jgi:poly(hydroxyalkanoate) depolymerase family esterase
MTDAVLLAALLAGTGGAAPAPPATGAGRGAGRVIEGSFRNAAGERRYKLFLPDGAARGASPALVVVLHGCTQDAADIARGSRMNEGAEGRGWMVLYPEQSAADNPRKCWNWYDAAHQARGAGEPSIIAGLTAQVAEEYGVSPERTWLTGISAGAAMASLVAAAYPERYAAIALHSGLVHSATGSVAGALGVMQKGVPSPEPHAERAHAAMGEHARVIPALVIHGGSDAVVVPINGAQAARQWFLTNALAMGQPLDTTSGASDHSVREENGYEVRRSTYRARSGVALAHLVMVMWLGHAWSGGSADGTFTDVRGPSATAMILDFFARQGAR